MILTVVGIATFLIMQRLDRLGAQVEAVCQSIMLEVTTDPDSKRELIALWKGLREDERKGRRQFWLFWVFIGAVLVAYYTLGR